MKKTERKELLAKKAMDLEREFKYPKKPSWKKLYRIRYPELTSEDESYIKAAPSDILRVTEKHLEHLNYGREYPMEIQREYIGMLEGRAKSINAAMQRYEAEHPREIQMPRSELDVLREKVEELTKAIEELKKS